MEVNTNLSTIGLGGPIPPRGSAATAAPPPSKRSDSTNLSTLDEALQNLPASRPQAVERARGLIANADYPSSEVTNKISQLLASKLNSQET